MDIPPLVETYMPEGTDLVSVSGDILGVEGNIEELIRDKKDKHKRMVLISGLSGAGKDTLARLLAEKLPALKRIKTTTTRPRRPEETAESDPYNHVGFKEFWDMVKTGDVLEYVEYAGHMYCTNYKTIDEVFNSGRTPLLKVDPVGAETFLSMWRKGKNIFNEVSILYFYVVAEDLQEIRDRLKTRGSSPELMTERIKQDEKDLKHIGEAQYIVINTPGQQEVVAKQMVAVYQKMFG